MIYTTKDARHIIVPWHEALAQLVPHARDYTYQDQRLLVLPNEHAEAKLARNLGIPVPSPILTRYDWRGQKPWDIQRTTSALLTENERAYVLSTMGTGKTRAALFAADYMRTVGAITRVLVVAPLSTLTPVWESEMWHTMPRWRVRVLHGSKAKRLQLLREDADCYVINHHGVELLKDELIARQFDVIIIDELAVFRNKSTGLWKALNALVNAPGTRYVWGMTGSPTPSAPTDAWAQVRMLTPGRTVRTMRQFQDITMKKVSDFRWVPRPEANDIVHQAMQPAVRFTREDVMELPETIYLDRSVTLDPETAQAYKLLHDKMRTMVATGENITAANEGVLCGKLLQVSAGYVYTDKGTVYELPNTKRLAALEEIVNETEPERKIIVFVNFIHALEGVALHLKRAGHTVEVVYGKTSRSQRDAIFSKFQNETDPRIIVAHPQCMSHGLTLTAANTIIWYNPTQSLETYEQANARITRPGQTSKTLIAHMVGTTVEKLVYQRLKQRGKQQGVLLDLFKNQTMENDNG